MTATTNDSAPTSNRAALKAQSSFVSVNSRCSSVNGPTVGRSAIFAVRMDVGDLAANGGQLRLCLLDRGARREAAKKIQLWSLPRAVLQRVQAKRNPELVGDRKSKTHRHDSDDRVWRPGELDGSAEGTRIRAEARPPRVVTNQDDWRGVWLLIRVEEIPPEERLHLGDAEGGCRDLGDRDRLRRCIREPRGCAARCETPTGARQW